MQNLIQHPNNRSIRLCRGALLLAAALLTHQAAAATSFETYARVYDSFGPRTVCNDFFCSSTTVIPPADIDDQHSGSEPNPVLAPINSNADAVVGFTQANATAVIYDPAISPAAIKIGVSASAQRSGYVVGEAHARAGITFGITIESPLNDPILTALATQLCTTGCALAMDFQHQTTGRFGFSGVPGQDAEAHFSETLSMDSGAHLTGEAYIAADPLNGNNLTPGANGVWSVADFYPPQSIRDGTELAFNHFETISNQFSIFGIRECRGPDGDFCLSGNYTVTIEQIATAGFGSNAQYTTFGEVTSDFAHTSEFSAIRLYDPSGDFDLSNAQINLRFFDPAPVPLPGAFWLFASALVFFSLKNRSARA